MCIYVRLIGERGLILVGVATDDIIQIGTRDRETQQELRNLRDQMDKKWTMTHSELITALGVQVQRNQDGSITLTQPAQVGKIQSKFFPTGEVPETYAPGRKGQDRDEDFDAKVDSTEYRSQLGSMSHMRYTRPDLRAALAISAESSTDPRLPHKKNLENMAAYIITTREIGLTFQAGPKDANPRNRLTAHGGSDASWSTTEEAKTRLAFYLCMGEIRHFKSRGLKTGAIVAKSIRETSTSRSAAGGELMAQVEFVDSNEVFMQLMDEVTGTTSTGKAGPDRRKHGGATELRHTLTDDKLKEILPATGEPTTILVDNRSIFNALAYKWIKPLRKLKTQIRHINIVKEAIANGAITQILVGSKDQPADMLTKVHSSPTQQFRHIETLQGTHSAITRMKEKVQQMRHQRKSQGRVIQISKAQEEEMATLFASVAMSGAEDTPKERAERELQKETDDNTVQAAKESPEMRQFRLDLSDRVKRMEGHKKEETRAGSKVPRGQKGQQSKIKWSVQTSRYVE